MNGDQIMRQLMRVSPKTCVRFRPTFREDDARRWYVAIDRTVMTYGEGGFSTLVHGYEGPSPEFALRVTWRTLLETFEKNPDAFLMRYTSPSNVPIPGADPIAWVRWNAAAGEWQDVEATDRRLRFWPEITREQIFPYNSYEIQGPRD